jgi:hypothetical protein
LSRDATRHIPRDQSHLSARVDMMNKAHADHVCLFRRSGGANNLG